MKLVILKHRKEDLNLNASASDTKFKEFFLKPFIQIYRDTKNRAKTYFKPVLFFTDLSILLLILVVILSLALFFSFLVASEVLFATLSLILRVASEILPSFTLDFCVTTEGSVTTWLLSADLKTLFPL